MTTPDLEPQHVEELRRVKDARADLPVAPIDDEANELVRRLAAEAVDQDSIQLSRRATTFVSKLVGWSSKDADVDTGCIPVATFERTSEEDKKLDKLGRDFLSKSPSVRESRVVSETHMIERFDFHQLRRNGAIREVTVYRKELLQTGPADSVEYYINFTEVGQHHPQQETILAMGRMYLESMSREGLAWAAQGIERPFELVKSVGSAVKQIGRSDSPES